MKLMVNSLFGLFNSHLFAKGWILLHPIGHHVEFLLVVQDLFELEFVISVKLFLVGVAVGKDAGDELVPLPMPITIAIRVSRIVERF